MELTSSSHVQTTPHIKLGGFESIDLPPTDFVRDFVQQLDERQKWALLACVRDGLLTDESFLNVSTYLGPDRVQVSGAPAKLSPTVRSPQ